MNKVKIVSVLAGAVAGAAMLVPMSAFAATTQTFLTLDGQTTATIQAGDSVDGVLTFNNTGVSTVQSVKVEIPNSGFPGTCLNVADQNAAGTHTVAIPVTTTGATEGTWNVRLTTYGINSNTTGANNNCDGTIGVATAHTFNNVLTLTQSQSTGGNANNTGTGSTGGTSGSSSDTKLDAILAWINLQLHPSTPPPATGNAAKCAAIAPYVNAPSNTYSSIGVQLQSVLLLDNPFSIPALHAGATIPMGYFGPQTHAALAAYLATYQCH